MNEVKLVPRIISVNCVIYNREFYFDFPLLDGYSNFIPRLNIIRAIVFFKEQNRIDYSTRIRKEQRDAAGEFYLNFSTFGEFNLEQLMQIKTSRRMIACKSCERRHSRGFLIGFRLGRNYSRIRFAETFFIYI